MIAFYARTLDLVLARRGLTLLVFLATIALTVGLYINAPKGYFPQDDTGLDVRRHAGLDRYFVRGDGRDAD